MGDLVPCFVPDFNFSFYQLKEVRTFCGFMGWLLGGSSGLSFNEMFIG